MNVNLRLENKKESVIDLKTYRELEEAKTLDTNDLFDIFHNRFVEDKDFKLRRLDTSLIDMIKNKYVVNLDEINLKLREIAENKSYSEYHLYHLCSFVTEPNIEYFMNLLDVMPYLLFSIYFNDHKYDHLYTKELIEEVIKRDNRNFIYLKRIDFSPEIQLMLAENLGSNFIGLSNNQTIEAQEMAFSKMTYKQQLSEVNDFPVFKNILFKEDYSLCDKINEDLLTIVVKTAYIMATERMYNSLYPTQANKFLDYIKNKDKTLYKRCIFELSISDDGKTIGYNILPF